MTPSTLNRRTLDDLLMSPKVQEDLELLQREGVLAQVFPEVQAMVGFGGDQKGHKDLWLHTKIVVSQCPLQLTVRWAALFHDVGKVPTFTKVKGKVAFHHHEQVSARLFHDAALRTRMFPSDFRREIVFLIKYLGYVESYASDWTDSAVRRLAHDMGDHFTDLIDLAMADTTSRHEVKRELHRKLIQQLAVRATEIARRDAIPAPLPKGLGDAVSVTFGIPPSRALGDLMTMLREAVETGELPRQGSFETYLEHIRRHLESP